MAYINGVQHISVFDKNPNLISGSEIGSIVKYYLKKDFYTFNDFKTVITRKFSLTTEQRKAFDEENSKGKEFLFNRGNQFEAIVTQELVAKYNNDYEIINFNDLKDGDVNKILVSDEIGVCAIPDILLKSDERNVLCEIKSSECGGKSTQNYKYQLALESLLVEGFYQTETISRLFFEFPHKQTGETSITLSPAEKELLTEDIKKAMQLLRADIANNALQFYTFEEMMSRFDKAETIESKDEEFLKIAREIEENKIQFQAYKASEEKLKELCRQRFGNRAVNLILTEESGMQFSVKHTVSKETYHTQDSKQEAIIKAKKALEEAEAIVIGSIKATPRFSVKVNLI